MAHRSTPQVVWITGASSGIGEALAREWARRGAHLILSARRTERLAVLAQELERDGGVKVVVAECDVTQEGSPEQALAEGLKTFGRLDVAVANAGFGVAGNFNDLSLADYRRQFETNVFGLLRTAKAAFPELQKTQGRIALLGSVAGHVSFPGGGPYSMSKYAVRAFAEGLRGEWNPSGVSVTLISPGFVESEIRRVDNQGSFRPDSKDPIPSWLVVPRETAAREIVRAIERRVPERVITGHGKVVVFLARHFSWLVRAVLLRSAGPEGQHPRHRAPSGRESSR